MAAMRRALPPVALLLGIAGLIPFAACGYGAVTNQGDPAAKALAAYVGWVALLLVIAVDAEAGLALLVVGFLALTVVEARATKAGLVPPGYMTLRYGLSAVVITILVLVVLLRLFHIHVVGFG
jgi:hypothetical protein